MIHKSAKNLQVRWVLVEGFDNMPILSSPFLSLSLSFTTGASGHYTW